MTANGWVGARVLCGLVLTALFFAFCLMESLALYNQRTIVYCTMYHWYHMESILIFHTGIIWLTTLPEPESRCPFMHSRPASLVLLDKLLYTLTP